MSFPDIALYLDSLPINFHNTMLCRLYVTNLITRDGCWTSFWQLLLVDLSPRVYCFLFFPSPSNPPLHPVFGCFDKINPQHTDELFKFDSVMYAGWVARERCSYYYRQTLFLQMTEPPIQPITIHSPAAPRHQVGEEIGASAYIIPRCCSQKCCSAKMEVIGGVYQFIA